MKNTLDSVFPAHLDGIVRLRQADAEFDEICAHFEVLIMEAETRFGTVDSATADLIASFDELRREIERRLQACPDHPSQQS